MDTEFNLSFSTDTQFDAKVEQGDAVFEAEFESPQEFEMSLDDGSELFEAELQPNEQEFLANFGNEKELVNTAPVTSVNGMVGDVLIPVPEMVSELDNDLGFITDTGMESLSNMEIESLLT